MQVLIVESNAGLGQLWARHLERTGAKVRVASTQAGAIEELRNSEVNVIILNLMVPDGSAFAIADFASYRRPASRIIFVTNTTFFSDGSIFRHIPNACAFIQSETPPDDLAAMVEHYGATG